MEDSHAWDYEGSRIKIISDNNTIKIKVARQDKGKKITYKATLKPLYKKDIKSKSFEREIEKFIETLI